MTKSSRITDQPTSSDCPPTQSVDPGRQLPATSASRQGRAKWALQLVLQPLLFFAAGIALLGLLGLAQKAGWIRSGTISGSSGAAASSSAVQDYICPMMCTPPQQHPGRCPVCAMELVPAATAGGGDERSIVVDPASRRVAGIQTVAVRSVPLTRTIRSVGELHYDERRLKTISAYIDGRFDELYVDFTGAIVRQGDKLASFYSPELYSAQIEYLQTAKTLRSLSGQSLTSVREANSRLQDSSRQRLIELGMSAAQIQQIERTDTAQSRMDILAPMSGTVIEKLVVEGQYIKVGQPIFRLADLSTVWLLLKLFPEDAAAVSLDQAVEATLKSVPGRTFTGHVTFIAPEVDPASRTVSVRVVMDNEQGLLRIGDYAKARIQIAQQPSLATVVPRNAVLMAAGESVVYVETTPGRFEIRRIVTGPTLNDGIVVQQGLLEGETVATAGNFLIDSQMQLAGNPSLIDPTRAAAPVDMVPGFDAGMLAAIDQLPADDRPAALQQVICPVTDMKLGAMGVPPKVQVNGTTVFLCCEGCRSRLLKDPESHLQKLRDFRENQDLSGDAESPDVPLPPIGSIRTDFDHASVPPIGRIEILSESDSEAEEHAGESAATNQTSGTLPQ